MKEQFADYETSKLFSELPQLTRCMAYYDEDKELHPIDTDFNLFRELSDKLIGAPLWQQAEQWLWDKYKIEIRKYNDASGKLFSCIVYWKNVPIVSSEKDFDSPITAYQQGIIKAVEYLHKNNYNK